MNIYVGNLNSKIQNDDLRSAFEEYGSVDSAKIIIDRETGDSKGFGFVEMPNETEALAAIENLNGAEWEDKDIIVNQARPRKQFGSNGNRSRDNFRRERRY